MEIPLSDTHRFRPFFSHDHRPDPVIVRPVIGCQLLKVGLQPTNWMTQYNKMFEYSNKSDQSRSFMQDSYSPIGKGSSAVIGQAFVLQDYSPIHIEVKNNGGSAPSQSMRLETEPYEDTSFDINRLYGSWEDENSDKILTLTSSFLEFGNSKSGSSTQYPGVWTDGNTLHTNFDKLGDTLEIVEDGDALRLVNDTVNLVQTENWPENGAGDGFVYYPTPSVTIDAWGNPALAFDLWFDNPGNAPSATITTTVSDENEKVLAKIRFNVG